MAGPQRPFRACCISPVRPLRVCRDVSSAMKMQLGKRKKKETGAWQRILGEGGNTCKQDRRQEPWLAAEGVAVCCRATGSKRWGFMMLIPGASYAWSMPIVISAGKESPVVSIRPARVRRACQHK
jgi:hypothetical protein